MHEQFLHAALEQAILGRGLCAPNPSVGAVAVHNGAIIAQAFHKGAGTPHAERLLLAQLPPKLPEVSVYLTLEPCNHWGKTPPCIDALIEYGVERVFFSYFDPNPLVAEQDSSRQLREQGIDVTQIPLKVIDDFYKSYHQWVLTGRPRVTVKMAQSLDGKIGSSQGARLILSNEQCSQFTHKQRAASDVLLTTAQTIHRDNPRMSVRIEGQEMGKKLAIIDRNLSVDKNAEIFSTASHCHVYHKEGLSGIYDKVPNCSYHPVPSYGNLLDLNAIIQHLGVAGYHDVWVEAGGALFSALHQQRLVDRTYLYLVPTCLGEDAVFAYQGTRLFDRAHTVSWQIMADNMILCMDWQED